MNLIQETRLRLACCKAGAPDGWGETNSLRNHMMRVEHRLGELRPFVEEVRRLPADDDLLTDKVTIELVTEYGTLLDLRKLAYDFLGIGLVEEVAEEAPVQRESFESFITRILK